MQHDTDAHFNPAVSIAFALQRELPWSMAAGYIAAQIIGAVVGVWAAHFMFELPVWQFSVTSRAGAGRWLAEAVATFGLLLTICGCAARRRPPSQRGRPLHHLGLLVHRIDIFRQSSRDNRALVVRHFRRDCSLRRGCIHRRAVRGNGTGRDRRQMALGK